MAATCSGVRYSSMGAGAGKGTCEGWTTSRSRGFSRGERSIMTLFKLELLCDDLDWAACRVGSPGAVAILRPRAVSQPRGSSLGNSFGFPNVTNPKRLVALSNGLAYRLPLIRAIILRLSCRGRIPNVLAVTDDYSLPVLVPDARKTTGNLVSFVVCAGCLRGCPLTTGA